MLILRVLEVRSLKSLSLDCDQVWADAPFLSGLCWSRVAFFSFSSHRPCISWLMALCPPSFCFSGHIIVCVL